MTMNEKKNPTREQYVSLAISYKGIAEGTPEHKQIIDNYNRLQNDFKMTTSLPWCACFVSLINLLSGGNSVSSSFPNAIGVSDMRKKFEKKKRLVGSGLIIPQQGDTVFYRNHSHVGIVIDVESGISPTITILSGNSSDMVKSQKMCYSDFVKNIESIGLPRFQ